MSATVIDGKQVAAQLRAEVAGEVETFVAEHGRPPGLATILVGEDAASAVYVGGKQRACTEVGIRGFDHRLAADAPREEVVALIERLNADPEVSGILCQLPVPGHLDGVELTNLIAPEKDVDGLTVASAGRLALGLPGLRPCTPSGVMRLLAHAGTELSGARAVVIGRSNLFGKPMAQLLLQANATVTIAHSRTTDLAGVCAEADVLVAAVGRPEMVRAEWIKDGAVVIDVGINRRDPAPTDGSSALVGDVHFEEAVQRAAAVTPVPGGVGPTTIAELLANTLQAARIQAGGAA
ncbi:bifunctional methylenetetrahydrofolate dehydrogenase/methenyltetrahydrofolate cyclohydrolase FolD [Patulibacter sp.]|uniref:bifunctional methylenetetrahydrofolate dehydrogenase/methenyltetrahydrofolate cyclohydrolase FolD n=1 Tax=Patulibacter sp. TaxID=1912859 RepID=UPI0027208C49|nr:bifunctional methylenetetrahydrofolate dehydrogenase/methenyltetrahydrofolate cyclohydrolase FolD [Patulibacter sp.]MDO9409972.1 bifunctional methylenetetrahydrofolate dehydrogenase/methenyltetrahydrofolate cyclohydrolase FolD [Patulibacter sp.]